MATRAKKPTKRRLEGSSISVDSSAGGKQRKPLSEKVANVQSPPVCNENSRVGRKKRGSVDAAEVNEISQEDIANLIQQTARDYGYNHDYTSILAVLKNPRDDRNRPLYKNSKVSQVEGVALVLASFALFPGASKEATSYLFYLLRNYLLPDGNCMPSSWDEARKLIDDLLTPKETIHVCVNDCVAFRKDRKDMKRCPVCKEDRYVSGTTRPRKKFHFLPLVPRLRRLYEIKAFSHLLSKHMDSGVANDIVRDIHDSPGWHRQFEQGGLFEGDPRHLLLQFCQDGMNPFDMRKNAYSMSPQLIKIMNLPMTAREKLGFLLLVGLIHGPKEPKNMDPYLEPLVDELLLLLEGVWAFDGLRKEAFKLKAKILLYVLDFVGLCKCAKSKGPGAVSPCSKCWIKGEYSHKLSKMVYTGARRYLEPDDPMRKDTSNFPDKAVEDRGPPRLRTAGEMETLSNLCNPETTAMPKTLLATVQKAAGKTGREEWRRLPTYSHENYVVDMQHTGTDVIEKVHGVMVGDNDTEAVRSEERRLGRFPECWEQNEEDEWEDVEQSNEGTGLSSKKKRMSKEQRKRAADKMKPGPWTLTKDDRKKADSRSAAVKVPVHFGWHPRGIFVRLSNMKSHDWKQLFSHGIMKFCVRGMMKEKQRDTLNLLCDVLSALCAPIVKMSRLPQLEKDIHRCLARLERDFPVTIMTVIVHWMEHIIPYIAEYGPTKAYWMYLYERMNSFISGRVKNRLHPEATVVESCRIYSFVQYMALGGFLPEGAVPTTTAQQMAIVEREEDDEQRPTESKTELSGPEQQIQLTTAQTTQLKDFHIKHTPEYQRLRKQLRAKYLHSPSKSTTSFNKWSSPKLNTEEREAMAGPSAHGMKCLRAVRDHGIEYRCKDAETRAGSVVSSYVAVEGQQMGSQVDVGRVNFFFRHSFLGEEFFLANVTWFPTATRDPASGLLRSDTTRQRATATATSFCTLSYISHPLVTARDPDDPTTLWILNFDNPYTC